MIETDPADVWGPEAITEVQVPHPLPDRAPPLLPPRPRRP